MFSEIIKTLKKYLYYLNLKELRRQNP